MVMGPTHAMSGAAAGLAVAQLLPASWGGVSSAQEAFVFAGIAAGAALLPDLDSPQATVSRSFGPVSQMLSHLVENVSQFLVNLTRGPKDRRCGNGHRTVTHTLWFALAAGAVAAPLISAFGRPATIGLLFVFLALAIRGLFPEWSKKKEWVLVTALAALLAYGAWRYVPLTASGLVLGSAVTVGVLAHLAGDFITKHGIPLFAPLLRFRGRRWWNAGLPKPLRVRASGPADKFLLSAFTMLVVVQVIYIGSGDFVEYAQFVPASTSIDSSR
ncbi:metal-dependent hydrolase [Corynebacterium alimapuense]|uniref:Metal-dependent hydrolase n=1 Tax=Corynebacterium alimapuense TaxID=1576874 RepID=A0A3M8KAR0_9CORY|nr:metal-dependent hydrolase [Corynebacterium alimapuense]RNE49875.1 hypothetical protein C5L39_00415 [Corynebacterium alimapuense]